MKTVSNECISSQQFIRFYARNSLFLIVLIIAVVILTLPYVTREQINPPGDEAYYYYRLATEIKQNPIMDRDELSFGGRENFMPLGWAYILAGFSYATGFTIETISKILLFLLGVGSLLLFYLILDRYKQDFKLMIISLLILSPSFIYLFTVNNRFAFPIFLSLLIFYFIIGENYLISLVLSLLLPFFGVLSVLSFGIFVLSYFYFNRRKEFRKSFLVFFSLLILSSLVNIYFGWSIVWGNELSFLSFVSDFGAKHGFSFFAFLLVCFGLLFFWRKKSHVLWYSLGFLLFLLAFKLDWLIFYLGFVIAFLAGSSLFKLYNRPWESNIIKNLTLWILICGLIFSGVSYVHEFNNFKPQDEMFTVLDKIPDDSMVLSHYSNGFWIEYSGKRALLDQFFAGIPDIDTRIQDTDKIFHSSDIKITNELLSKYEVDYIFIDKNMRDGEVWNNDEEGLLFLLGISKSFKLTYNDGYYSIWEVVSP